MKEAINVPMAVDACGVDGRAEGLKSMMQRLEMCQKSLNEYLDMKKKVRVGACPVGLRRKNYRLRLCVVWHTFIEIVQKAEALDKLNRAGNDFFTHALKNPFVGTLFLQIFPRFYFVSNVALLDMLANGTNPPKIMPYLGDCYDSLANLTFITLEDGTTSSKTVNEMVSTICRFDFPACPPHACTGKLVVCNMWYFVPCSNSNQHVARNTWTMHHTGNHS